MDDSERLVERYLKACGFRDIVYEPDGNIPPDFLVDRRVAVEVRRLNQMHVDASDSRPRGLETDAIALERHLKRYLTGLRPVSFASGSWWVSYDFKRPVAPWNELRRLLDSVLLPFMNAPDPAPFRQTLSPQFRIWIQKASVPLPTFFALGGKFDRQAGGFVVSEIIKNIVRCAAEKSEKIAKYRQNYPEWWLVMPDFTGFSPDSDDFEGVRAHLALERSLFHKVVVLNGGNLEQGFQVWPN